jgi:hypothetical protein
MACVKRHVDQEENFILGVLLPLHGCRQDPQRQIPGGPRKRTVGLGLPPTCVLLLTHNCTLGLWLVISRLPVARPPVARPVP